MALSLLLTLLFEGAYALIFGVRGWRDLLLVALVNILTNPAVVLLHTLGRLYAPWSPVLTLLALETAAVLTEGLIYRRFAAAIPRPMWFALGINAFSYALGELFNLFV